MKRRDLTWRRFGRLVVVSFAGAKNGRTYWLCRCDCGNTTIVAKENLINGNVLSCKCLQRELSSKRLKEQSTTHGLTNSKLHNVWHNIKSRCMNKNSPSFHRYGGRGITICDEWKNDFMSFYTWAINNGYKDGLSIDRINNDMSYTPDNCRWISMAEQGKNRCTNVWIEFNGENMILEDWAKRLSISISGLRKRLKRHTLEEALTIPVGKMSHCGVVNNA